jgi:phosphatidylserine decarboxylase
MARTQESYVLAPTHGTITYADASRVTIYISTSDNHDIFAPVAGHVDSLTALRGYWRRPTRPDEDPTGAQVFQAYETKKGRAIAKMTESVTGQPLEFWIEVGSGYVTDRVLFRVKQNQTVLRAGARIGEIILGSLSEVHLPGGGRQSSQTLVKAGDIVIGGTTPVAVLYR